MDQEVPVPPEKKQDKSHIKEEHAELFGQDFLDRILCFYVISDRKVSSSTMITQEVFQLLILVTWHQTQSGLLPKQSPPEPHAKWTSSPNSSYSEEMCTGWPCCRVLGLSLNGKEMNTANQNIPSSPWRKRGNVVWRRLVEVLRSANLSLTLTSSVTSSLGQTEESGAVSETAAALIPVWIMMDEKTTASQSHAGITWCSDTLYMRALTLFCYTLQRECTIKKKM